MPRKAPSQRALGWQRLLAFTIVMPLVLWLFGYWSSRTRGCESVVAVAKASAYALSWIPGWLVYAFTLRRCSPRDLFPAIWLANINITILEPKAVAWPFQAMLRSGVWFSLTMGFVMGLGFCAWRHFEERGRAKDGAKLPPDRGSELA